MARKPGNQGKNRSGSGAGRRAQPGSARKLAKRVKTAKGRRLSSTRWLQRQLNDPYVAAAQKEGLRSRAAYKLIEIDDRYKILKPGMSVIDLGAAPGGWSLVASERVRSRPGTIDTKNVSQGRVIALDLAPMEPIAGVTVMQCDFMADDAETQLYAAIGEHAINGVLSDMAAPSTGHKQTDHLRIIALCEAALDFATKVLAPDGFFLAKVLQGGTESELLAEMKRNFRSVRHVKPEASRSDSSELYVLATGFRGPKSNGG